MNVALIFIKPHAVADSVKELAGKVFSDAGITVRQEGSISSEDIDSQGLIDTHYGSIAKRALSQKPSEMVVQPKGQGVFEKAFGMTWSDALDKGLLFNAKEGGEKLGMSLEEVCSESCAFEKNVGRVKLGGGFSCAKVGDIYVINAFYYLLRSMFTIPGKSIYYYVVEWDSTKLTWCDFRARVIGETNPAAAPAESLRGTIFSKWQELGLEAQPDIGNNGIHASASPFEGLAERANWLHTPLEEDPFGKEMLAAGIPLKNIEEWMQDPNVLYEGSDVSVFDLFEDQEQDEILRRARTIINM